MTEEYIPEKGDLVWDVDTGEPGMVAGWLDEDFYIVVCRGDMGPYIRDHDPNAIRLIAKEDEIKPGIIRLDDLEVGEITAEEIEELKRLLPQKIILQPTRPTDIVS